MTNNFDNSDTTMAPSDNWRLARRSLFLLAGLLLSLQLPLIVCIGEFYPSVRMPGFQGSGGYNNGAVTVTVMEAVFLTSGKDYTFSRRQLLEQIPDSFHGAISDHCLTPMNGLKDDDRRTHLAAMKAYNSNMFPGHMYAAENRTHPEIRNSLTSWLATRAKELLPPGSHVTAVEFQWFKDRIRFLPGRREIVRIPIGTFRVPMKAEGAPQ